MEEYKMKPKICVLCNNNKFINSTNNRLVTESCGHVKCMDCLLIETSGCSACIQYTANIEDETEQNLNVVSQEMPVEVIIVSGKPNESSHITADKDEKGHYYLCTKCNKKCRTRSQLMYHAYCNGRLKPFQCPIVSCGKSFVTRSHYVYHMRVHRNEKTYSCDVCSYSFISKSKLKRHMLKHTNEKNYTCDVPHCSKAFNNKSSLKQHIRTHTEDKPHQCHICGAKFHDRSNYYKHVAKHDDKNYLATKRACVGLEKKYQCPRCTQTFHSGKDMRRHSAVHLDSKPFRCKICTLKCFRRKDNLERHIRNSHPECKTSTAIEVDEAALAESISLAEKTASEMIQLTTTDMEKQLMKEVNSLKSRNPFPPLSDIKIMELSQKPPVNPREPFSNDTEPPKKNIDTSYILEANNARESVIFVAKSQNNCERKALETTDIVYVHKLRKANSMATQRDVNLPPINEYKVLLLGKKTSENNLDVGSLPMNVDVYHKILSADNGKESDKLSVIEKVNK